MTTTDGRPRAGGEPPGPADPPGTDTGATPTTTDARPAAPAAPATPSAPSSEAVPDDGPVIARMRARTPSGRSSRPSPGPVPPGVARRVGRHAMPEGEGTGHTPPPDYRPRHAAPGDAPDPSDQDPGQDDAPAPAAGPELTLVPAEARPPAGPPTPAAPPDAEIDPTPIRGLPLASTFPASAVLASEPAASENKKPIYAWQPDAPSADHDPDAPPPARQRIVLAERRSPTRAVGTVAEIEQQTATGELLLSNLMRSQLALAVRLAVVGVIVLGVLPIVFLTMPSVGATHLFGVSLPWILLGVLAFPFLILLGWLYTRTAERNELDFADDVED
ncbi:hypothetical protein [Actinomycetospora termitidis]|uniref:DUF485 domain-containing protein n=1 Tax=Actinomycetospora termitidis TaxID=3053470 RepID=A0ABT7M252_9PSEU|nr:hypothetical protein [Actinomycetospora sp. Odt1-22]MDL5154731.1 hypothetical protein [Actinomycetospora sp. Odt1-22]